MNEYVYIKKKFWLWSLQTHPHIAARWESTYMDENGYNTVGNREYDYWDSIHDKYKHEGSEREFDVLATLDFGEQK